MREGCNNSFAALDGPETEVLGRATVHAGPLLGGGIVRTAALCPTKPGPQTVRRGPGRRSSSAFVLVDQPAEDVTAADRAEMLWPPVGCIYSIASLTCTDVSGITFLFLQVPASQPEDEGDDFRVKRVAGTIVAVRVRAAPGDKLTVLAHESRRRDEEDRPALTREQPCKRREQRAIGGGVPGTRHLAAQSMIVADLRRR